MAATSVLDRLSERPGLRHHHRIQVTLKASLERGGESLPDTTINTLSRCGLQVVCPPETLEQLIPNGQPVAPHMAIPVHVTFRLPIHGAGSSCIRARCGVVMVRRTARDCYHVGMSFTALADDAHALLEHYIREQLAAGA
ncbi:PilZ domain-containing protein [Halomonadaceae bacterium KBTZ08]